MLDHLVEIEQNLTYITFFVTYITFFVLRKCPVSPTLCVYARVCVFGERGAERKR